MFSHEESRNGHHASELVQKNRVRLAVSLDGELLANETVGHNFNYLGCKCNYPTLVYWMSSSCLYRFSLNILMGQVSSKYLSMSSMSWSGSYFVKSFERGFRKCNPSDVRTRESATYVQLDP